MPSINFTFNSVEFDFDLRNDQSFWYCEANYKNNKVIISAKKDIFEDERTIEKLKSFCKIISLNIEKIQEKSKLWIVRLYNELGSFEMDEGYFGKEIFIKLVSIEIETFFDFEVNLPFFSKRDLIMDINHKYYVMFKSINEDVFVEGVHKD
ncbi:hypothetical protein ASG01_03485 [Chryseobacterium sp. Leaf180]|jgi:hypothetical protein|uniref:hypothetical protein n=1 Tax=Chryseobacterium sp. Leaf180 TaxID=1736289 RepID=UPI000701B0C7|nr:hypothetical protein [Chryseobacterium sp. Leaf180]KQR94939.1 hypothetical protein ASG01_03485 [Chryseobacterium sp. Leaf180]